MRILILNVKPIENNNLNALLINCLASNDYMLRIPVHTPSPVCIARRTVSESKLLSNLTKSTKQKFYRVDQVKRLNLFAPRCTHLRPQQIMHIIRTKLGTPELSRFNLLGHCSLASASRPFTIRQETTLADYTDNRIPTHPPKLQSLPFPNMHFSHICACLSASCSPTILLVLLTWSSYQHPSSQS